jgi:hypothetical protein
MLNHDCEKYGRWCSIFRHAPQPPKLRARFSVSQFAADLPPVLTVAGVVTMSATLRASPTVHPAGGNCFQAKSFLPLHRWQGRNAAIGVQRERD